MAGRKSKVPPSTIVDAVLLFKDRVIFTDNNGEKRILMGHHAWTLDVGRWFSLQFKNNDSILIHQVILFPHVHTIGVSLATNSVWQEICSHLHNRMSSKALHTFVYQDRHGIKEKLGFPVKVPNIISNEQETFHSFETDILSECSDGENLPTKNFVITFSEMEWEQIKPEEVSYKINDKSRPMQRSKTWHVLPKNSWTPVIAEHFWIHTELPCCISFRRAKVYPNGSNYITIVGICTICGSNFKGTVSERPPVNVKVLMQCTYIGNYDTVHNVNKKRRLIGPTTKKALSSIIDDRISCETFREREAVRLMKIGASEPSIIPSGNALRVLKSCKIIADQRHSDTLMSLKLMKNEETFKNIIHDVGCDPFFVYYNCAEQIHMYRGYCKNEKYPKLIIDATGSVVKKFIKLGVEKTSSIFLYEDFVYDSKNEQSFTATNMLSERHSNIAISNWLLNWLNSDVQKPKEVVCDQSLALLSAITKSFTQYSSLDHYLIACADMITGEINKDSYWVPQCYIRIDVAHFIKNCTKWKPLKDVHRRVRETILRSIGVLIKCQSLTEIHSLLLSMFVVLTNETCGTEICTGKETPCDKHTQVLMNASSTGFIDTDYQFEELLAIADTEDQARILLEEEYERQNEGLDCLKNPFLSWAENIYEKSKSLIKEGSGINPLYMPNLVPVLIKSMKLLPLWSGVMIPIFGYGNDVSSSAAIESSFNKLKNVTMKNITLPCKIEIFLENHIMSLRGALLIRAAKNNSQLSISSNEIVQLETPRMMNNLNEAETSLTLPIIIEENDDKILVIQSPKSSQQFSSLETTDSIHPDNEIHNFVTGKCPLCTTGSLPSENGSHKCNLCKKPVHAISLCSTHIAEHDNIRICFSCSSKDNYLTEENDARESWDRQNKRKRTSKSYLLPNPHLRHLNLKNTKTIQSLPILKNGSRFGELKSCKTKFMEKKVVLSHTCAFDSFTSLLMVSYCDSPEYAGKIDSISQNIFLHFVSKIVKQGITATTYSERADLIINQMKPNLQLLQYDTMMAVCDATISSIVSAMLKMFPTITETTVCSTKSCQIIHSSPIFKHIISYQTIDGNIKDLEQFLDNCLNNEESTCGYLESGITCNGIKRRISHISDMHLFIDIFYWEGEEMISNDRSSEASSMVQMRLCDIPELLIHDSKTYELRGVISFHPGKTKLRNSIGHYNAYAKRGTKNWELFDDLKNKPIPIKENKKVPCELLVYTI